MRATVRLADGSLVEGELVTGTGYVPAAANACAGGDFGVVYWLTPPTSAACIPVPIRTLPPSAAACAGNPSAYLCRG